jgi:hypothetical protein
MQGLSFGNAVLEDFFLEEFLSFSNAFHHFVAANWNHVFQAAFVFQLQPMNPAIPSLVSYAAPREDSKAQQTELNIVHDLRAICSQEYIILNAFAVNGDTQDDPMHSDQDLSNRFVFQSLDVMPTIRKLRVICDARHLLDQVKYRLTKVTPMVIALSKNSHHPNLCAPRELLGSNLRDVMFSDTQRTKIYDSLPMIFFRFQHLILLMDANVHDRRSTEIHLPCFCFCLPWVLSNEEISHPDLSTQTSLIWFKMACFYLMICQDTGQRTGFDKNVKEYGNAGHNGTKKLCLIGN